MKKQAPFSLVNNMKLAIYKPQNKILQACIDYFYILERNGKETALSYIGFPNINTYCTLFKYADVTIKKEDVVFRASGSDNFESILIADYRKFGSLTYKGRIFEITICFKPLGINSFISTDFSKLQPVSFTNLFAEFKSETETVFSSGNNTRLLKDLELYLLKKHNGFSCVKLNTIINQIQEQEMFPVRVNELAKRNRMSRVTLNTYFLKNIGTSPSQFIKVNRFRNAIKGFCSKVNDEKLVDIAYLTEYFDQSHMIKDFKAMSGCTPKTFFKKLTQLENGKISWIMEKRLYHFTILIETDD